MKSRRLVIMAAIGCMSIVFLSSPAYAQLGEVIADYCEQVGQNVTDTLEALGNASLDLKECDSDLNECLRGQGLFDEPSNCVRDYARCVGVGERDQAQACSAFLREFLNDTRRAERSARFDNVGDEFLDWYHGDSASREACIQPAQTTLVVCTDQLRGEEEVIADAGTDLVTFVGDGVILDGSGSTPEGGSFFWEFEDVPAGSQASLSSATTANPVFTPDELGNYTTALVYEVGSLSDSDTVNVQAIPVEEPPDPSDVCDNNLCANNAGLSQECSTFMDECTVSADPALCALGGWYICQMEVEPPPETDTGSVCGQNTCAEDPGRADTCGTFLVACLAEEPNEEECVAGAWLYCLDLFGD